jgi:hypothetical protein
MIRGVLALCSLVIASATAHAKVEFRFTAAGYYCETEAKLLEFIGSYVGQNRRDVPDDCGLLYPGDDGSLLTLQVENDRLSGRIILREKGKGQPVHFFTVTTYLAIVAAPASAAPSSPSVAPPAAKKEEPAARSFKVVSPADVRNTPDKWIGRDIQFSRVNVYWVADDDVRFLTGVNLTLFGEDVRGDAKTITHLKENCETSREANSGKCVVNVKFKYTRHGEDSPGGLYKRTVLSSDDIEVELTARQRRR